MYTYTYTYIHILSSQIGWLRADAEKKLRARFRAAFASRKLGWHYLSNATCLIRPRLFLQPYLSNTDN